MEPYRHLAAGRTGRPRPDRPRPLVHRRLRHPREPSCCRGGKKNGLGPTDFRPKKPTVPNRLGGRKWAQTEEPSDYALGRSRGGFGTKVHLVCDRKGFILALRITAGQVHESKAFEGTMARRLIPDRRGRRRWPDRLAADKGYSYPRIRIWCNKRRIKAMIPIREARSQLPCLVVSRHHGSGPQTPIAKQTLE